MSLSNLIEERRVVEHDGRRFLVRKLTVEAAAAVISFMAEQIVGARAGWLSSGGAGDADPISVILPAVLTNGRGAALVLARVVDLENAPADLDRLLWSPASDTVEASALREKLARACCEITDWDVLLREFNWDLCEGEAHAVDPSDDDEESISEIEAVVVGVATMFSRPPHEVMRWPAEEVVHIGRCFPPSLVKKASGGEDPPLIDDPAALRAAGFAGA